MITGFGPYELEILRDVFLDMANEDGTLNKEELK